MSILLGCVADDFTGATDLANTLVKAGMRTVQLLGVPRKGLKVPEADCIIVALKSRSNPASEAVTMSLAAMDWLRQQGARQLYFKYCSTFDSTDKGNIGPVADAMLDAIGADFTVFNPSFPTNKRTVYKGYLFVGDELLSESGMRHHPLTPMTEPSLVRVLQRQTKHKVGLVQYSTIVKGATATRSAFDDLRKQGIRHAVLDSITDDHLMTLGEACADMKLVTGGSGMAMGLPANFIRQGLMQSGQRATLPKVTGPLILDHAVLRDTDAVDRGPEGAQSADDNRTLDGRKHHGCQMAEHHDRADKRNRDHETAKEQAPESAPDCAILAPEHDAVTGIVKTHNFLVRVVAFADNAEVAHVDPAGGKLADGGLGVAVAREYGDDCFILVHGALLFGW